MAGQIWDKMVLYYSGLLRSGQTGKKIIELNHVGLELIKIKVKPKNSPRV